MNKFNAELEIEKITQYIRHYYKTNNLKGAIIGISGGKDSGVVAALMCKAIGKENVVGLTLPCYSHANDKKLAQKVARHYGFKLYNFDLTEVFKSFVLNLPSKFKNLDTAIYKNSDINLKPRLRMLSFYYFSAMMSAIKGGTYIVIGTSNKCELYVGYFTKGGDNVNDFNPIADFTVTEVIKIGEALNVPKEVLYRTPSDGLSGMSDEERLGVTYKQIEMYMQNKNSVSIEVAKQIEKLHQNNMHKFVNNFFKRDM